MKKCISYNKSYWSNHFRYLHKCKSIPKCLKVASITVELVEVHASWPEYHGHTRGLPSQFQEPRVDRGCIFVENLAHMCSLSLISSLMHRPAKSAEAKAWRICTRQMLLAAMHKKLQYMRLNLQHKKKTVRNPSFFIKYEEKPEMFQLIESILIQNRLIS